MTPLSRGVALLILGVPALTAGASAADKHEIPVVDVEFGVKSVVTHPGDRIEWVNSDPVTHSATALDGSWDVDLMPGQSGSIVVTAPGVIPYLCRYHPNMRGEIVVSPQ